MNIDIDAYLKAKNFKIFNPATLFDPDLTVLKKRVCPICFCKLYERRDKAGWVCKSKKHRKDKFYRIK